jgi:hypothetical protein
MSTDNPTGFSSGLERSQAAADAGGVPRDDPSIVDKRSIHAVGGVGCADTYGHNTGTDVHRVGLPLLLAFLSLI